MHCIIAILIVAGVLAQQPPVMPPIRPLPPGETAPPLPPGETLPPLPGQPSTPVPITPQPNPGGTPYPTSPQSFTDLHKVIFSGTAWGSQFILPGVKEITGIASEIEVAVMLSDALNPLIIHPSLVDVYEAVVSSQGLEVTVRIGPVFLAPPEVAQVLLGRRAVVMEQAYQRITGSVESIVVANVGPPDDRSIEKAGEFQFTPAPASPDARIFELKVTGSRWTTILADPDAKARASTLVSVECALIITEYLTASGQFLHPSQSSVPKEFEVNKDGVLEFDLYIYNSPIATKDITDALHNAEFYHLQKGMSRIFGFSDPFVVDSVKVKQDDEEDSEGSGTTTVIIIAVVMVVVVLIVAAGVVAFVVLRARKSAAVSPSEAKPSRTDVEHLENGDYGPSASPQNRHSSNTASGSLVVGAMASQKSATPMNPMMSWGAQSGRSEVLSMKSLSSALSTNEAVKFQRGKLLGRGAFGAVYSVLLDDGQTVAAKEISWHGDDSSAVLGDIRREIDMMKQIEHPFILRYFGMNVKPAEKQFILFMELVTGGSLASLVRSLEDPLSEAAGKNFVAQITLGVAHIHSLGVVHRDLKGDNVLLATDGTVKLGDFGSSKRLIDAENDAKTITGTPYFMAPEVATKGEQGYGFKADVWSLGITVGEILSKGTPPWPKFESPWQAIMYIGNPENDLEFQPYVTPGAKDFIRACIVRDPARRPSATDLLEHPYIRNEVAAMRARYFPNTPIDTPSATPHDGELPVARKENNAHLTPAPTPHSQRVRPRALSVLPDDEVESAVKEKKPTYKLGKVIGSGAFGTVYIALLEETGEQVAAKKMVFQQQDENLEKKLQSLQQEMKVMKTMRHEHLVKYIFADRPPAVPGQDPCLFVFMEYVPGGTLTDTVKNYGRLPEKMAATVTAQLLLGLGFLHANNIVHRDIKPANCLITTVGQLKVSDFGTAKEMRPDEIMQTAAKMSMQGTPAYMAPEIIRGGSGAGTHSDIWSVGCTVMEILTGEPPWSHIGGRQNPMKAMTFIASNEPATLPEDISPEAADFLFRCLQKDPARRSTCQQLLSHKWIKQFDIVDVDAEEAAGLEEEESFMYAGVKQSAQFAVSFEVGGE